MTKAPRKPMAVKIGTAGNQSASDEKTGSKPKTKPIAQKNLEEITITSSPEMDELVDDFKVEPPKIEPTRFSWGNLLLLAFGGLASLAAGLALDSLIRDLFQHHDWLGWFAIGLVIMALIAMLGIIAREIWAISRLNTITKIRLRTAQVMAGERPDDGHALSRELEALYASRTDLTGARAKFNDNAQDILDGDDILNQFERDILQTIDEKAKSSVMQAAKRVSVVTAISPRALVDIAYVLTENIRLIRRISQLYGGRPGTLGFWRLTRNVLAHLAVTGSIAIGDSLVQQVLGHGIAARLSAKLGEGVINGLLTARVGLAAIDQSRPMNFHALPRPVVSEYFKELANFKSAEDD